MAQQQQPTSLFGFAASPSPSQPVAHPGKAPAARPHQSVAPSASAKAPAANPGGAGAGRNNAARRGAPPGQAPQPRAQSPPAQAVAKVDPESFQGKLNALQKSLEDSNKQQSASQSQNVLILNPPALSQLDLIADLKTLIGSSDKSQLESSANKFFKVLIEDGLANGDPAPPFARALSFCILDFCKKCDGVDEQAVIRSGARFSPDGKQIKGVIRLINSVIEKAKTPNSTNGLLICLGVLYKRMGHYAVAIVYEIVPLLVTKIFKSSDTTRRIIALETATSVLEGTAPSPLVSNPPITYYPDVLKGIKQFLTDKIPEVRAQAARCLAVIAKVFNDDHMEQITAACGKLIEDSNSIVRHEGATCLGIAVATAYITVINPSVVQLKQSTAQSSAFPTPFLSKKEPIKWTLEVALQYLLSQFTSDGISKETRTAVAQAYASFFDSLSQKQVLQHLLNIITSLSKLLGALNSDGAIHSLQCVDYVIYQGLAQKFGETGQQSLAKFLVQIMGKAKGNDSLIIASLRGLVRIMIAIGEGSAAFADQLIEALQNIIFVSNSSVRLNAILCLRTLVKHLPRNQAPLLQLFLEKVQTAFSAIATQGTAETLKVNVPSLIAASQTVASIFFVVKSSKLGVPSQLISSALALSTEILSIPENSSVPITVARSEAGWTILSALFNLGPTVLGGQQSNLTTILSLWKAALPKTTLPQNNEKQLFVTISLKSYALSSVGSFLDNCPTLLNTKLITFIVVLLNHCLSLTASFNPNAMTTYSAQTQECINIFKLRLAKAFLSIKNSSDFSTCFVPLLKWVAAEFIEGPSASLLKQTLNKTDSSLGPWITSQQATEDYLLELQAIAIPDTAVLWQSYYAKDILDNTTPLSVSVVDNLINILPGIFPLQSDKNWSQLLTHFANCIKNAHAQRKLVIQSNTLCAILKVLQSLRHKRQNAITSEKYQAILDFIQTNVSDPDPSIRRAAGECFGFLASLQGDSLTEKLLITVTNVLKQSQDPSTRAGCGFVLGCIYRYVGGVSCSQHLPAIISLLHVLCKDQNPSVYIWALHSLYLAIEASGLSFASFANPTLSLIFSLILSKTFDSTLPTAVQAVGRIINATVTTLGPELEINGQTMKRCTLLVVELRNHPHSEVQLESIIFRQMLVLFAPHTVDVPSFLPILRPYFTSDNIQLRRASIICLRQLAQINPQAVSSLELNENLFVFLDNEADVDLRNELELLITTLIDMLGSSQPSLWLEICRGVIISQRASRATKIETKKDDEEDEDEGGELSKKEAPSEEDAFNPSPRTKTFAMECIKRLIVSVKGEKHFDLKLAKQSPGEDFLVVSLQDLVGTCFNATTAQIDALAPVGIEALREVVKVFGQSIDPEVEGEEVGLLMLYQAQISSAIRPSFAEDAHPLLTAATCSVLVEMVKSNITNNQADLKKILNLLLPRVKTLESISYGVYSEKAASIVQLAVLTSLAQIRIMSLETFNSKELAQKAATIRTILEPFLPKLKCLWTTLLRDYAILTTQPRATAQQVQSLFYTPMTMDDVLGILQQDFCGYKILKATSTLVRTNHWNATAPESDSLPQSDASDNFNILLGLCLHSFTINHDNDVPTITCLEGLAELIQSENFNSKTVEIDNLLEITDSIATLMNNGTVKIKLASMLVIQKLIALLYKYIQESAAGDAQIEKILYSTSEIITTPLFFHIPYLRPKSPPAPISNLPDDIISLIENCLSTISSFIQLSNIRNTYTQHFIPLFVNLLVNLIPPMNLPQLRSSAVKTLNDLFSLKGLSPEKWYQIQIATVNSIAEKIQISQHDPTRLANLILSLGALAPNVQYPPATDKIISNLKSLANAPQAEVRIACSQLLRTVVLAGVDVATPYIKGVLPLIIAELETLTTPVSDDEAIESFKVLGVIQAVLPENLKGLCLAVIVSFSIGYVFTKASASIRELVSQALLRLASTNATEFRQIVAALPDAQKVVLENALRQNTVQAAQTTTTRQVVSASSIQISLDVSKFA